MKSETMICCESFAAAFLLGVSLILATASPSVAGISGFSIISATIVPGGSNKQVVVTGTVTCPAGKVVTVGIQMVQQGKMAAHAWGKTTGIQCSAGASVNWGVTASSAVPMKVGFASTLAGAWACIAAGTMPAGPCEFAHYSGDISLK